MNWESNFSIFVILALILMVVHYYLFAAECQKVAGNFSSPVSRFEYLRDVVPHGLVTAHLLLHNVITRFDDVSG